MRVEDFRKMLTGKSKMVSVRTNPELLRLVDDTLKRDKDFVTRSELFEVLILRYLDSKGKLRYEQN